MVIVHIIRVIQKIAVCQKRATVLLSVTCNWLKALAVN